MTETHEHEPHDTTPTPGDEAWRKLFAGEIRGLTNMRRVLGLIPSEPRCKLCSAPFGRPGSSLLKLVGYSPSRLNRRLCRACIRTLEKLPGGAEVEISLLFADVRGSTALAERIPAQDFSRLMSRFSGVAARVVDRLDGIVDKFVGDEVVALFIPVFAGENHAEKAVGAARELMKETGNDTDEPWIAVGAGVHTGLAYVGRVGEGDACDFTAVGDSPNLTARLASSAGAGEILVSAGAAEASRLDTSGLETRTLALRGRDVTVDAWVARA